MKVRDYAETAKRLETKANKINEPWVEELKTLALLLRNNMVGAAIKFCKNNPEPLGKDDSIRETLIHELFSYRDHPWLYYRRPKAA